MSAIRVLALCSLLAVVSIAGVAVAGTPLPPPFFGGFVAPDRTILGQENDVRGIVQAYYRRRAHCQADAVHSLQHAYASGSPTALAKAQAKWTTCDTKARMSFADDAADRIAHGTPACLDETLLDELRAFVDGILAAHAPVTFCDVGGAASDPIVGINVPDKEREADGEGIVSTYVGQASLHTEACLVIAMRAILFHHGVLLQRDQEKLDKCLAKAESVTSSSGFLKLVKSHLLPPCLTAATTDGVVHDSNQVGNLLTSVTYCASPGGAFLDGDPVL